MTSDKQIFSFSLANPSPKRIDLSLNAKKVDTPPTDPTHTRRILQVNICYQTYLITKEFNRIEKSLTMRTNMYTEKFHKRSEEIQAQQQLLLQKVAHHFSCFLSTQVIGAPKQVGSNPIVHFDLQHAAASCRVSSNVYTRYSGLKFVLRWLTLELGARSCLLFLFLSVSRY